MIWFSGWTEFHILQFLMIVMMEILLWIKCIILFFLLFFHHASGLLTDQLFNFCLKKKICFTSPFHHDFTGVYRCLRRRWFELPQTCYSCVTTYQPHHFTALHWTIFSKTMKNKKNWKSNSRLHTWKKYKKIIKTILQNKSSSKRVI